MIFKPLVWLAPVGYVVYKLEKGDLVSLGITAKNLFPAVWWGLGLGVFFAVEGLAAHWLKYGRLNLGSFGYSQGGFVAAFGLSLAAAVVEETVFRGYFFTRLRRWLKSDWAGMLVSAGLFSLMYLPVSVFQMGWEPAGMAVYLLFVFFYGIGAAAVFNLSGNLVSSILLHLLWSWPILLFR